MRSADTQALAMAAVIDGVAVEYRGHKIPVAPEEWRENEARARQWVIEHAGKVRRGPKRTGDTRVTVTLPDDQVAELDRRAAAQGVSRAQVVRDLLTDALG